MTDYAYRLLNVFSLDGNRLSGTKQQGVFRVGRGRSSNPGSGDLKS